MSDSEVKDGIRLDKWLKLSRIYKTRAQAARACDEGKVKINGRKAKPARMVQIGDQLTIKFRKRYRRIEVITIVYKNVSKKEARNLYHEHQPELTQEEKELSELLQDWDKAGRRKYKGRPTKKERRELEKFRRGVE